ncbi:hypothetical protein B0J13DRAFT_85329 [Dactylonectria estremocensis]|uniref:Uncharacterized protein n=1 Tax=Dactylonectria estremocensis TaxID=1079267 RepID=A0A9P9ECF2_9HYPO|nr:hypothetical protein B0J13DRAFT_85329 [Dactylonectria estremocensis]
MRLTIVTSLAALCQLALGVAMPQQTVELQVINNAESADSGCRPYQAPGCCVPTLCQCRDGRFYLFNKEDKRAGGNGCNPPWEFLGESLGAVGGYCC